MLAQSRNEQGVVGYPYIARRVNNLAIRMKGIKKQWKETYKMWIRKYENMKRSSVGIVNI